MDPDATYKAMIAAIDANDYDAAREHAEDLKRWLDRGGFPPQGDIREIRRMIDFLLPSER